jgi:uncharacterized protein YdeI (YjbR/CyaY-like superfamily)
MVTAGSASYAPGMAPVVVDTRRLRAFASAKAFETWLSKNHDRATEIWLRIYKKDSGVRSVNHAEALDVALCWGWIDGIRKAYDGQSFLQRFTPRRPKSIWSQINRRHVARLVAAGRMTPYGLEQVTAAKADGRWQAAYAPPSRTELPKDLLAAIEAKPKALQTFEKLNKQNRFALAFRVGNMKTPAGRTRKIQSLVAMLARGETPVPAPAKVRPKGR